VERQENQKGKFNEFLSGLNGKTSGELEKALKSDENEILRELAEGIQEIRFGSITLVVHDGKLVEATKTVRIRPNRPGQKD